MLYSNQSLFDLSSSWTLMKHFINASIIEKLPDDHFGKISEEVLDKLLNGQCCGVYGIPGYGMDFFAKHVALLIAKKHPKVQSILLNLELENDKVEVLEKELTKIIGSESIDEINFSRYLKNDKIVIILSEVYHPNHSKLFQFLNALRSINDTNLTVLTVANYTLFKNPGKYLNTGRMVFASLKRISNFDLEGVRRIIKINNEEYNWHIPLNLSKRVLFLSGGNPALVKAICMAIYEEGELILDHPKKLIRIQPLDFRLEEIAKLFTKLTIEEQIQIGLLNNNGTIFSELLAEYLRTSELEGIDKLFPDLSKTDRKILGIFVQNPGEIIDKEQLSLILGQTLDTYSEWAIYKAVARVRGKVKDKYKIKTLKGKGWRLENT